MSDPFSAPTDSSAQPPAPVAPQNHAAHPAAHSAARPAARPAAQPAARSSLHPLTLLWYLCVLLLGAVVGLVGTVMHRQWAPWILLAALVTVAVAGVLVRAWLGGGGLVPYGVGWLVAVQALAAQGPGGDVIMPAQPVSYAWMIGGMVMIGVAAFAPRRWFLD